MGKGDQRSKRGKISRGTFGKKRLKQNKKTTPVQKKK
ncbi:MAG: 30S ribosomal protein THX [Spirochaetes bacterium]|nr:30S ribosomal protein THX [Spirochaetota bacterium]